MSAMSALSVTSPNHLDLESVNNAISECMDKDEQPWDYYEQLQSSQNGKYHYDSFRLTKDKEIAIPKAISDSIHNQQVNGNANANVNVNGNTSNRYFGGFFECINRAYFVVNSSIYLWDYENKNRWCCLNQFDDEITSICLIQAKKNMFIDKIKYLLIVATKIQIVIIGIGFTNNSINGEIEAFPTKYSLSTDNVLINKIIADKYTKRIFLCCNYGNVYEFEYFYTQNLFGQHIRKCTKTNISDSFTSKILKSFTFPENLKNDHNDNNNVIVQNNNINGADQGIIDLLIHDDIFFTKCLFSLSSNGDINGYKFYDNNRDKLENEKSKQIKKILSYSRKKLLNEIQLQIQQMTNDNQNHFHSYNKWNELLQIIGLYKIDKYESQNCQLMAITKHGDRLFFAINGDNSSNLWNMELAFIRIRPPFLNYHGHHGHNGYNVNAMEPSIQPSSPQNIKTCFHKNGIFFMNSFKNNNTDCLLLLYRNNIQTMKSKYFRQELSESIECDMMNNDNDHILAITQMPFSKYMEISCSFLLFSKKEMKKLNNAQPFIGLSPFSIQNLLPCTKYLCLRKHSIIYYKLERYIDIFKKLLLQCGECGNYDAVLNFIDKIGIIECYVMSILLYIRNETNEINEIDEKCKKESYKLFQTEINNQMQDILYSDIMQRLHCQTPKLLSIYLCLSRLLRPIWCSTICIININHNNVVSARYSFKELYNILNPLQKFKHFLISFHKNEYIIIIKWISKCIEILNLLIALTRCQFNNIYDDLNLELQTLLKHISFEQLLIKQKGTVLLKEIISLLILKLNENDIEKLHKDCPTYFTTAQYITFLAKSQLNNTSTLQNALTMFFEVCDDESFNLINVCDLLRNTKYYNGVCQLIFKLEHKLMIKIQKCTKDIQQINQLKHHQQQQQQVQQPQQQQQQYVAFQHQMDHLAQTIQQLKYRIINAWQEIFKCLKLLFVDNTDNQQHITHNKQRVLTLCLQHDNRDFLYKLYSWFLNQKLIHLLFRYKPKYFENFLTQNITEIQLFDNDNNDDNNDNKIDVDVVDIDGDDVGDGNDDDDNQQTKLQKERNNRLIKLVYFYKENRETNKMVKLLDALTKVNGFSLQQRNNFLIEAKRATKSLNSNRTNFDPHNVVNDKYNKFEEKSILCQIQLNLSNELSTMNNVDPNDFFILNDKLLNIEEIYNISKKYQLFEYCLDCLSFTNDPNTIDHINSCWYLYIANIVQKYNGDWTKYLQTNLYKIVNKYNLQQQPWMFDIKNILFYLNNTNLQTHAMPSDTIVIDIIYPNINHIKYPQLIIIYKDILNQIDNQFKLNIIQSIYYLITKQKQSMNHQQPQQQQQHQHQQQQSFLPFSDSSIANPRLLSNHHSDNNTQIIQDQSSSVSIQDLISTCIHYLERENNQRLYQQFQELFEEF